MPYQSYKRRKAMATAAEDHPVNDGREASITIDARGEPLVWNALIKNVGSMLSGMRFYAARAGHTLTPPVFTLDDRGDDIVYTITADYTAKEAE